MSKAGKTRSGQSRLLIKRDPPMLMSETFKQTHNNSAVKQFNEMRLPASNVVSVAREIDEATGDLYVTFYYWIP